MTSDKSLDTAAQLVVDTLKAHDDFDLAMITAFSDGWISILIRRNGRVFQLSIEDAP